MADTYQITAVDKTNLGDVVLTITFTVGGKTRTETLHVDGMPDAAQLAAQLNARGKALQAAVVKPAIMPGVAVRIV
jgi:hypothetical protein